MGRLYVFIIVLLSALFGAYLNIVVAAPYPNGMLLRAEGDSKIYYLENDKKRWIESVEIFRVHGFKWNEIQTVSGSELSAYETGEALTARSMIMQPGELLPDIVPLPATELSITKRKGQDVLIFSTTYWNRGKGPLELIADPNTRGIDGDIERDVYQRIYRTDGGYRDKLVGNFQWHSAAGHLHYHYRDFINYIFEALDVEGDISIPKIKEKRTYCVRDMHEIDLSLSNSPQSKAYLTCNKEKQGVSVGWGDKYSYTLSDQYLVVDDLPKGTYRLSFHVNPDDILNEITKDNNRASILLYIDVKERKVEPLYAINFDGDFEPVFYPNGTLIRAEEGSKIFVIHNNKKRWVQNEAVFNSYGFSWNNIKVLPQRALDAIPYNNLVRVDGITVYALNDQGYKRHIRNSDIFTSYQLSWQDVADISAIELAGYPDSNFIKRLEDENIYFIDGNSKGLIQTAEALNIKNFNQEAVQVINDIDFDTYITGSDL